MTGILVVFYAIPVGSQQSAARTTFAVFLTLIGVALLGWAIVGQIKRQVSHSGDESVHSLLMLLGLVAVVFALGYFLLEEASPGQVIGLQTRTDALYFTVSTLTTVGYGDVHAKGQVARALVTLQLVFDVVFVAALVSILAGRLRSKVNAPRTEDTNDPSS